ncbi:hypothetical protein O0L34_g6488 [Tuta absoluta]|nr:hypothetical protein O0L34_g6488 [Tuta absoluta]
MSGVNEEHKYYKTNKFKYVVVHIDLKGAPPKISFLKSMLKEVKLLGANALLMEYEDMFPYENELKNLSQPEHYKKSDLTDFLTEANAIGVEIIPLIQTFGHMESVLKLDEFKYLREDSTYLDSICPSKLGTEILIAAMLRQVIKLHQAVVPLKHIHVGCDEVWNINKCDKCLKQKLQNHEIFFKHLDTVTNLVRNATIDAQHVTLNMFGNVAKQRATLPDGAQHVAELVVCIAVEHFVSSTTRRSLNTLLLFCK